MKKYLEKFVLLQADIKKRKKNLAPKEFYIDLLNWGISLKEAKDLNIYKLYQDYISYFEELNINDCSFEPLWYNFDELIEVDFLREPINGLNRVVVVVRDILWEIVAFKTDRDCKITNVNNLRLLTDKKKEKIYFCCDVCGYLEDIDKIQVKVDKILYPASADQITKYKIKPGRP